MDLDFHSARAPTKALVSNRTSDLDLPEHKKAERTMESGRIRSERPGTTRLSFIQGVGGLGGVEIAGEALTMQQPTSLSLSEVREPSSGKTPTLGHEIVLLI